MIIAMLLLMMMIDNYSDYCNVDDDVDSDSDDDDDDDDLLVYHIFCR